jgi:alanyl-tRNA synthetase
MAHRLYRADSYLQTFEAQVISANLQDGKTVLVLDQTAFYPAAGGQPYDTGTINNVPVVEVIERKDGEILHVVDASVETAHAMVGHKIDGAITWHRRFDHMQQHSGQHVLSQAFVVTQKLDTIAVHIGADDCTLDLPIANLSREQANEAEAEANRVIYADMPFWVYEIRDEDLTTIPLRRPPKVTGKIRIVEIKNYDWSACGGTHVSSTGQIGLIKITNVEKRGAETRITFRCGERAMRHYNLVNSIASRLANDFKVAVTELETTIAKLRDDARTQNKKLAETNEKLLGYEANDWVNEAPMVSGAKIVVKIIENDASQLRLIAKVVTNHACTIAALACVNDKTTLCFARSADVKADMRVLLKNALEQLDPKARGGGSAEFAQGGCMANNADIVKNVLLATKPNTNSQITHIG